MLKLLDDSSFCCYSTNTSKQIDQSSFHKRKKKREGGKLGEEYKKMIVQNSFQEIDIEYKVQSRVISLWWSVSYVIIKREIVTYKTEYKRVNRKYFVSSVLCTVFFSIW